MNNSQINTTTLVSQSINSLLNNLFSSIDTNIYSVLDDITFVDTEIITDSFFKNIFGCSSNIGILLISNSLFVGLIIFYAIRLFSSNFISNQVEQPFQFIFKAIILGIFMNFSYFLCSQLISLNSLLSLSIREIGENVFNINISFNEFIKKINAISLINEYNFNIFSFNGLIKSFTSFGLINLLFAYSLRYVMIKVFVLLSPFSILSLINSSTAWFFKSWFKGFISLLLLQSLVSIILLIIFSINFFSNDSISKLLFIGSIYALIKANHFMKEIIGGISTDCSINLANFKNTIL